MVTLRPILPEDRERMLDILTDETVKQTYMLPDFPNAEAAAPLFLRLMEMSEEESKYVRAIAVDDHLAGFINHTEITGSAIELGYVIHPDCQRKGYMTQALKLAIEELFSLGYRQVITGAFSTNAASIRCMGKCGMVRMEKTDEIAYRGKTHRCVYYFMENRRNTMLKYPCLVLDHDDTVVQTLKTLSYPFWCLELEQFRPGQTMTLADYVLECYRWGFADMCRKIFSFTDEELKQEHAQWSQYILENTPDPFPGIERIIRRQKELGGKIFVVSHSSSNTISRDYDVHFGIQPDAIYGWDRPPQERKPNPWPLEDIMAKYGFKPEEILVVDDMQLACQMADPLGVKVAFAGWDDMGVPELRQEMQKRCAYTFDSVEEFEKFLFEDCV